MEDAAEQRTNDKTTKSRSNKTIILISSNNDKRRTVLSFDNDVVGNRSKEHQSTHPVDRRIGRYKREMIFCQTRLTLENDRLRSEISGLENSLSASRTELCRLRRLVAREAVTATGESPGGAYANFSKDSRSLSCRSNAGGSSGNNNSSEKRPEPNEADDADQEAVFVNID